MIKAILFDFDGTLSDRQLNAYLAFKDFLKDYFDTSDRMFFEGVVQDMVYCDMNGTMPIEYRIKPFAFKYHMDERFEKAYLDFWLPHMHDYTYLREETDEVLTELKKRYKIGIITNGDSFSQHSKLTRTGVERYADEVIVSGDIEYDKPDRRIFEEMARRLDVRCDECIYVGDTFSYDIYGAYNAGMVPVWIWNDDSKPSDYDGYRINSLYGIFEVLKDMETKESNTLNDKELEETSGGVRDNFIEARGTVVEMLGRLSFNVDIEGYGIKNARLKGKPRINPEMVRVGKEVVVEIEVGFEDSVFITDVLR